MTSLSSLAADVTHNNELKLESGLRAASTLTIPESYVSPPLK